MKTSALFEIVAKGLALGGVLMFGFGIFPWVNPKQFELNLGPAYLPACVFSLASSIVIILIAWRLTREAQRCRQEEETRG